MGQKASFQLRARKLRRRSLLASKVAGGLLAADAVRVTVGAMTSHAAPPRGGGHNMQNTALTTGTASTSPSPVPTSSTGTSHIVSTLFFGIPPVDLGLIVGAIILLVILFGTVVVPVIFSPAGFASAWAIRQNMSPRAAKKLAGQTRPSIDPSDAHWTEYAVRIGKAVRPRRLVTGSMEDTGLIVGPSRAYKSVWLANVVLDWPGSVVHTTTKIQDVEATYDVRSEVGPVFVFNPYNLGTIKSTFVVDLVAGCEEPAMALRRTALLLYGARRPGDTRGLDDFFHSTAADVMRAYLHAAALAGLNMRAVYAWTNDPTNKDAVKILREYGADQSWIETLEARQDVTERTRDGIYTTLSTTLSWMADPAIARAVCPQEGDHVFDIATFLQERGTLYLVAELRESDTIAPLMTAFLSNVIEVAKAYASMSPTRRLDPPLLLAGDEIGNIAPVPLPSYMSELPGLGILTIAAIQSRSQMVAKWGETGASTIWNNAAWTLVLAGLKDTSDLKVISDLCGEREHRRTVTNHGANGITRSESVTDVPVMSVAAVRQLPKRRILAIYRGQPPVVVKVAKSWRRRDVRRAKAAGSNKQLRRAK